jgi:hypothetical protein
MNNFIYIDFRDYSPSQICSFVTEQIHAKIEEKLLYLNNLNLSNALQHIDQSAIFNTHYVQLVDKIHQLIQLEQKILFGYINQQTSTTKELTIPSKSKKLILQFQYDIKSSLLRCRTLFQDLEYKTNHKTITSIIEFELQNLEQKIAQWFYVVNKNILQSTAVEK